MKRIVIVLFCIMLSPLLFSQEENEKTFLQEKMEKGSKVFIAIGTNASISQTNLFNDLDIKSGVALDMGFGVSNFIGFGLLYNNRNIEVKNTDLLGFDLAKGKYRDFGLYAYYELELLSKLSGQFQLGYVGTRLEFANEPDDFRLNYNGILLAPKFLYSLNAKRNIAIHLAPTFYFYNSSKITAPQQIDSFVTKSTVFELRFGLQFVFK